MSEPRNDFNGEAVPWYMRPEQDPVAPPPARQGTAGPAPADDIPADKPAIVSPPAFDGDDAAGTEILAEESIFVAKPVFASSPPAHSSAPASKDSARLSVAEFLASGPQPGLPRWAGVGPAAPRPSAAAKQTARPRKPATTATSKPSPSAEAAQTEGATSSGGLPAASWPLAVKRQAEAEVPTSPVGLSLAALRQAMTEPPRPAAPPPDMVGTARPQASAQSAPPAEELHTEMLVAPSSFVPARVQQPAPTATPESGEPADDEPPAAAGARSESAPSGEGAPAAQQEPAAEVAAAAAPEQASAPVTQAPVADGPVEQDTETGPASSDDALAPAPLAGDEPPLAAAMSAPPAPDSVGEADAASAAPEAKQEDAGEEPVAPDPVRADSPTPPAASPDVESAPAPGEVETTSPGDGPSAPTYPAPGEAESATPDGETQLAEASAAPSGEPRSTKVPGEAVTPVPLAPETSDAAAPGFEAADAPGTVAAPDAQGSEPAPLTTDFSSSVEAPVTGSAAVELPAVMPPSEEDVPSAATATQVAAATAPPSPAPAASVTPPELAAEAAILAPAFTPQTPESEPTPAEAEPELVQVHTEAEPDVTPVSDASAAPASQATELAASFEQEPAEDLPAQDSPPDWSLAVTESAPDPSSSPAESAPAESAPAESAPQPAPGAAAAEPDAAQTPTPAPVEAAATPAEVDAAPAPHPAAKGPAVPEPATPVTEPLATPRRDVPAVEERPPAAPAVGDSYPLNAAAPTAADAAPSDAWMRALDAEYRRPVDPAEAAAQSTADTPADGLAGSEQTPPTEQPPAAAVPPPVEQAPPEAPATSPTAPDPGEVDSTAIRRYSLLSAARTREPSKPATDSTPNLVYDDAYELVGPESPTAPTTTTPSPDKESDRPAASATAPAPVRRRSRRELLAAENGTPHRGPSERHSGEGPAALTGKRPRLTSPHPPVLSETPSSGPTVHEIAANVAASLSGSTASEQREPARFVDTEEERTAPLASLSTTEDTLVADKGLLAGADFKASTDPATGRQPGGKSAEAADAVAPPTAPRGFGLAQTATGPETTAKTAQLPPTDPEESPAWQPLGPDDIKPRRPRPAPTATRPEAVLDGASVQPAPLSRSSAHWWSLLVALVLAPLGWGLTWDAANRLMGTTVTQVFEQKFAVIRPGVLPLLELVVGLLLLAVVFLAGRWSAAGLLVVGAVWSAVGLLALLLPEIFLSPLEPLINDMLAQASFWPSVAFLLLVATISGQLLFFGVIMLFGGLISHGARRQGQREQASLDALQRRQSS